MSACRRCVPTLSGEDREKLGERFALWLGEQEAAQKELWKAYAATQGEEQSSSSSEKEEEEQQMHSWQELMPRGLDAVYNALSSADPSFPQPPYSQSAITGLLRVLDVDSSGGVSAQDFQASVLHKTPSSWITKTGRFRVTGRLATKSSSRAKASASPSARKIPPMSTSETRAVK